MEDVLMRRYLQTAFITIPTGDSTDGGSPSGFSVVYSRGDPTAEDGPSCRAAHVRHAGAGDDQTSRGGARAHA